MSIPTWNFFVVWIDDAGNRRDADYPYCFQHKFQACARAYQLFRRDGMRFGYQVVVNEGGLPVVLLNLSKYASPSSAEK